MFAERYTNKKKEKHAGHWRSTRVFFELVILVKGNAALSDVQGFSLYMY